MDLGCIVSFGASYCDGVPPLHQDFRCMSHKTSTNNKQQDGGVCGLGCEGVSPLTGVCIRVSYLVEV